MAIGIRMDTIEPEELNVTKKRNFLITQGSFLLALYSAAKEITSIEGRTKANLMCLLMLLKTQFLHMSINPIKQSNTKPTQHSKFETTEYLEG